MDNSKVFIIELNEKPIAKARPRFSRRGKYVATHKVKGEQVLEDMFIYTVKQQMRKQMILNPIPKGTAVEMSFFFTFGFPKSYSKKKRASLLGQPHTISKDLDNMIKFYCDGLNGVLYHDDCQISRYNEVEKIWGETDKVKIIATWRSE